MSPLRCSVHIGASFYLLLFLALTVSPPAVVAAVLSAAALHELGHLAALRYFGVRLRALRLTALGAVLDAPALARLSYPRELTVTLSGIAVNFLCALPLSALGRHTGADIFYLLAGAHLVLAAFNLLPISPLDGARALALLLALLLGPVPAERICTAVSLFLSLVLCALGGYLSLCRHCGWLFALAALGLLCGTLRQLGLAPRAKSV